MSVSCQYLQKTVPKVGNIIVPIETALRDTFFPILFDGR